MTGNKINATCKRTLIVIENVTIKLAGGQYRPTNHPYKMTIAEDAMLSGVHELGDFQTVQVSGENRKRVQFRLVDTEFVI
ncbi:hypothetical protein HID58_070588 [Brassica napus]|uniref:DUF223 domain-containing protein n=1 Tax=Brassica napus TaxID=3708 RepID=A0ABQ7YZ51_BRANA|nr:hypothetical protein HID58_070588 [Brassica napus]